MMLFLLAFLALVLVWHQWKSIKKEAVRLFLYAQFWYVQATRDKRLYEPRHDIHIQDAILSMTTSPSRISTSLPKVLHVFARQFRKVEINLPMLYRGAQPYAEQDIQALVHQFPNLQVFRFHEDLGPIMKLLPTLERHAGEKLVILTVDDDAIPETAALLDIAQQVRATNTVVTCLWRQARYDEQVFDIVFGNLGNGFPAWRVTSKLLERLRDYAIVCRLHDDFAIGTAFAREGIAIQSVETSGKRKYQWPMTLYEGLDGNALWSTDMHIDKEAECAHAFLKVDETLSHS